MNKLFIKGISFCVLILISLNVLGNPFVRFSVYNNQNSHINNYIQDLIQDQIGLIWFSTYDGLYRYDGNTFKCYKATFNNRTPLVSNHIDLICENSQHNIWCLASGDVYLFNRLMSQFYEMDKIKNHFLIKNWNICAIYNHAGKTFFSSDKGGLFYVIDKDSECTPYILQVEKERQYYKSMVNDTLGNLWVFYNNQTLVLDSVKKKILPYEFDKVLWVDKEYWLINKNGMMAYFDLQSQQIVFLPDLFNIKRISSSLYDKRNFVILSTDKGLVVVDVRSKQQRMLNVNNCIRGG